MKNKLYFSDSKIPSSICQLPIFRKFGSDFNQKTLTKRLVMAQCLLCVGEK